MPVTYDQLKYAALLLQGGPWYKIKAYGIKAKHPERFRAIPNRENNGPYLERFSWIPRRYLLGLAHACIHKFLASDAIEDGLHDHPWPYLTYILEGGYIEVRPGKDGMTGAKYIVRKKGDWVLALPWRRHRVELFLEHRTEYGAPGEPSKLIETEVPCWTLFIMGPRTFGNWKFYVEGKAWPWREWIAKRNKQRA